MILEICGFIAASYIISKAKENNEKVLISGQGADEIISDYYNIHTNSRKSCMKGDWTKATKPWRNFYGGWNAAFLAAQNLWQELMELRLDIHFLTLISYKLFYHFLMN